MGRARSTFGQNHSRYGLLKDFGFPGLHPGFRRLKLEDKRGKNM